MHSTQSDRDWHEFQRDRMRAGKREQERTARAEAAFNAGYDAALQILASRMSLALDVEAPSHRDTRAQRFRSWQFETWRQEQGR